MCGVYMKSSFPKPDKRHSMESVSDINLMFIAYSLEKISSYNIYICIYICMYIYIFMKSASPKHEPVVNIGNPFLEWCLSCGQEVFIY